MPKKKGAKAPKKAKPSRPRGRPSSYTKAVGDRICHEIAHSSRSLRTICAPEGMPDAATVVRWLHNHEEFRKQYALAKEQQAEFLVEEILEIADDGRNDTYIIETENGPITRTDHDVVNRSRLRVDARKWVAARLAPKKFGDRLEHSGPDGGPIQVVPVINIVPSGGSRS